MIDEKPEPLRWGFRVHTPEHDGATGYYIIEPDPNGAFDSREAVEKYLNESNP